MFIKHFFLFMNEARFQTFISLRFNFYLILSPKDQRFDVENITDLVLQD